MVESPNLYNTKDGQEDNIRIFVPIDTNRDSIIRRLNYIVSRYGEANEENETNFSEDVAMLIFQIEIYDQIWSVRHGMTDNGHSKEAVSLVERFVEALEEVLDGCAEEFPFCAD